VPSGLKGTSHSFPQSAQVALCISLLLPYDIFLFSTPTKFVCAKVAFTQHHLTALDAYKLSAYNSQYATNGKPKNHVSALNSPKIKGQKPFFANRAQPEKLEEQS
jgi:hypothetical protein